MARKPGAGRKPAKSEQAAGLINALTFLSCIKAPTPTSMPYNSHTWLNEGMAVAYDGIVAAGHPIDGGIGGYPHTKLLIEALENTGKQFDLTVNSTGQFEITSDKYTAVVPSLAYDQVIPTVPDANVFQLTEDQGKAFVSALVATAKVVSDTAENVLHASVRLEGQTVLATDGATIIEAFHGLNMPQGVVLPKQFVTSLNKTGKSPVGIGLGVTWETFTVWFQDGSWLRTNAYPGSTWPDQIMGSYYELLNNRGDFAPTPPELWKAVNAVLPFTSDNNRVIFRPGLVRTHPDRRQGAALEIAAISFELDINGKRLAVLEGLAENFAIGSFSGGSTFVFQGTLARGVVAGLAPLAEPEPPRQEPQSGGWTTPAQQQPASGGQNAGWSQPTMIAPPPENEPEPEAPASDGWGARMGIPNGTGPGDPEFDAGYNGGSAPTTETQSSGDWGEVSGNGWGTDDDDSQNDDGDGWNNQNEGFSIGGWLADQKDVGE